MAAPTTLPKIRSEPRSVPGIFRAVEREARVYRTLWKASVFSYFVGPALYLGAMGIGLGGLVDASGARPDGLTYLQFVAPGLLVATIMQSTSAESLWPTMAGIKWVRFYHSMAASPMRPGDIYGGVVIWLSVRMTMSATSYMIIASLFGAVTSWWGVLAIPAAVLCGAAFAAPICAFAAGQDSDSKFVLVMRFVVLPLFLFSGVFFPITQLPNWMQLIAWASPLWHGVELCRAATTGVVSSFGVLVGHVVILLAFIVAGAWWGTRTFRRKLCA